MGTRPAFAQQQTHTQTHSAHVAGWLAHVLFIVNGMVNESKIVPLRAILQSQEFT